MLAISAQSSRSCRGGGMGGLFDLVARKYGSELASVTNLLVAKRHVVVGHGNFILCFLFCVWVGAWAAAPETSLRGDHLGSGV